MPEKAEQASRITLPENARILIVKLSAVGDVVHALPVLNALRDAFPKAHLAWVAHPGPANLLEGHPQLNQLIVLPRRLRSWYSLRKFFASMIAVRGRPQGWDCVLDLQGLTKSGVVTWWTTSANRIGFSGKASREVNSWFMTRRVAEHRESVIEMNLELLGSLGIDVPAPQAVLHWDTQDEVLIREWAGREQIGIERLVIIDTFAGWPSKLWERDKWIEFAKLLELHLGLRALVFYGPGEREEANKLGWALRVRNCRPVVAPDTTLRQYLALLKLHGAAFVGGDTGPMHMAAAMGLPTVALFGASDPKRNAPCFANARYTTLQDLSAPCAGSFRRKCSYHAPGMCMSNIEPQQVIHALEELLKARASPAKP